ncbi:helix-turn-helix domain-containing protein [Streptomyces sporangiiformans]|uniref:Helix-turn-helix domain-containing protein n=1 Tax=Streptomyces sporangiiformans TaxID=2315329 RepID=A0A505DQ22_9ACTN|nr:helix-turn-helix domain-containing protein [Streptomyces sporangiiformans]TPQ23313.1 helix-turn-helix domain-containing protein [Streptomyces sporangiiformans]
MRRNDYEGVEQFEAAASQSFVPLRIRVPAEGGLHASLGGVVVDGVVISRIVSTPCKVRRDVPEIGSGDRELVKIALHRRGRAGVEQNGQRGSLRPGDLVAYDTSRPYELRYWDDFETFVIGIPRSRLGLNADLIGRRCASPLSPGPGVGQVVSSCITGLGGNLEEVSPAAAMHLADALVSLIISAFTDAVPSDTGTTSDLADRILAYCLANLADPALSVGFVARRHGISVRYLQKLLSQRDMSLAAWIRRERLHRIHRDLSNPSLANRTTVEIVARWGILDPTHLSRALKAEFGRTAQEIRRAARP